MSAKENVINLYYDLKIYHLVKNFVTHNSRYFLDQSQAIMILFRTSNEGTHAIDENELATLNVRTENFIYNMEVALEHLGLTIQIERLNIIRYNAIVENFLNPSQRGRKKFISTELNNEDLINYLLSKYFFKSNDQEKESLKTLIAHILMFSNPILNYADDLLNSQDRELYDIIIAKLGRLEDSNSIFHHVQLIFRENIALGYNEEEFDSISDEFSPSMAIEDTENDFYSISTPFSSFNTVLSLIDDYLANHATSTEAPTLSHNRTTTSLMDVSTTNESIALGTSPLSHNGFNISSSSIDTNSISFEVSDTFFFGLEYDEGVMQCG